MPADLDGEMTPVRIEDVKRVVVDIRGGLLSFDVVFGADIPHRRRRSTDEDQKQALGDRRLGQICFRDVVLALAHRTVDDRNVVRFGVAANAAAETAGHPHQVGIFEGFVRSGQRPPPHPKPTGTMPHAEVGVQNDPIHAIVAAVQQILIESAKSIAHARYATSTPLSFKLPRRGHFFEARSAKKRSPLRAQRADAFRGPNCPNRGKYPGIRPSRTTAPCRLAAYGSPSASTAPATAGRNRACVRAPPASQASSIGRGSAPRHWTAGHAWQETPAPTSPP